MKEKKSFNVRMSKDLWVFLKNESARRETPMVEIIENCLLKMKEKLDKKVLTYKSTDV